MNCPKCGKKMKKETELGIVRWRCPCGEVVSYSLGYKNRRSR